MENEELKQEIEDIRTVLKFLLYRNTKRITEAENMILELAIKRLNI